jgi:polyphenol oxidase
VSVPLSWIEAARGDLPLYFVEGLRDKGVDLIVTRREGGVSPAPFDTLNLGDHVGDDAAFVTENRRRVAAAMGVQPSKLVVSTQVHGAVVNDVDAWAGEPLVGDAMVTTRDDVALAVLVADCLPLLFFDRQSPRFAVAHAGWRGLEAHVITATLSHFADPEDVRVVIGPHISPARYQVGPEVAEHFASIPSALHEDQGDRHRLDLEAVTRFQLAQAGIAPTQVQGCALFTDDGAVFFSDRAQRPCGRFGLIARRTFYDSRVKEGTK